MPVYYNEVDPYCVEWLRRFIAAGHIAPGEVDERSIVDAVPTFRHTARYASPAKRFHFSRENV